MLGFNQVEADVLEVARGAPAVVSSLKQSHL